MTWGIFICGELYMKTDREHLLELRKELNELTQLVIIMGIKSQSYIQWKGLSRLLTRLGMVLIKVNRINFPKIKS